MGVEEEEDQGVALDMELQGTLLLLAMEVVLEVVKVLVRDMGKLVLPMVAGVVVEVVAAVG